MTFPFCLWGVTKRLRFIALLVLDCDGVLTDGTMPRRFNVYDGAGIKAVLESGIKVIVLSGSYYKKDIEKRANQLGIEQVFSGIKDKGLFLKRYLEINSIDQEQVLYVGDDLNDLSAIKVSGMSIAPKNAVKAIKKEATRITKREGGEGAVREVCDLLLKANGKSTTC